MRPFWVGYFNGKLEWSHPKRQPYAIYIRGFKDAQYQLFAVAEQNKIDFPLTDVQVQIRALGDQPDLSGPDDYYLFSPGRVHTDPNLSISYVRDSFRNQLPESLTARFDSSSNLTRLQEALAQPVDWLVSWLTCVHDQLAHHRRVRFTPTNRSIVHYPAEFSKLTAFEYNLLTKQVVPVELKYNADPEFPDAYVPVHFIKCDLDAIFPSSAIQEPFERSSIFAEQQKQIWQLDTFNFKLYLVLPSGSVVQQADLLQQFNIIAYDTDFEYLYVLDDLQTEGRALFDDAYFDASNFDQLILGKRLLVYKLPTRQEEQLYPLAQIPISLPHSVLQMRLFHGQMLLRLATGRVCVLTARHYSYSLREGDVVLNDTFHSVQFERGGRTVKQRLRLFEPVHTSTDDLLQLFGMHRARAETAGMQLARLLVDLFENQHVSDRLSKQFLIDVPVSEISKLEDIYSAEVIRRLIQAKALPHQPDFATAVLDKSGVVRYTTEQLHKSRYDEDRTQDAVTAVDDEIQRRLYMLGSSWIQALSADWRFIQQRTHTVAVESDGLVPFKYGYNFVPCSAHILRTIVHVTDVDAGAFSSLETGKTLVLSNFPYERLMCNISQGTLLGTVNGMYAYQLELPQQDISIVGMHGGQSVPLIVFDSRTVAYQIADGYMYLSMPLKQFYITRVVSQ